MADSYPTEPAVISAAITPYAEVRVEVTPYLIDVDGRRLLVGLFYGDTADRGGYLVGRGTVVKKDGTVGTRTILVASDRTPQVVRDAASALFA